MGWTTKMAKRVNGRKIKAVRTYTIEEAADALGVSVVTVRSWQTRGLQVIKDQRPYLIVGSVLKAFLQKQADARKMPLAIDQFYCAPCKRRDRPMGGMADYVAITPTKGCLVGLCPRCERQIQRFANVSNLHEFEAVLDIVSRDGTRA